MKPKCLQVGDTVAVIAPASPPNKAALDAGIDFLKALGLKVRVGKHTFDQYGYLAGLDKNRLADLHEAFLDQEVKGIFCACGGYGTARIAEQIDYSIIANNPKIFWGYSDITFLHTAIHKHTGLVTFHGPMLSSDIGKTECLPETKQRFNSLFSPQSFVYNEEYSSLEVMVEGVASGLLVGGNLSLLASSIGTPYEVNTKDKLLLIEDINEEPRSVDRMLNQLLQAGKLEEAKGIIVGDFHQCDPKRENSLSLEEVLHHYISIAGKPAVKGFKIGHCTPNIAVPLGVYAILNTKEKNLVINSGVC